eukprot:5439716-Amphidinium_carterae.1
MADAWNAVRRDCVEPLFRAPLECRQSPRYPLWLWNRTGLYKVQQPTPLSTKGVQVGSSPGYPASRVPCPMARNQVL